jgi:hypothetical protein
MHDKTKSRRFSIYLRSEQVSKLMPIEWGLKSAFFKALMDGILPYYETYGLRFITDVIEGRIKINFTSASEGESRPEEENG